MADNRPWYRQAETFIALAALVVSVSAVVVGIYEASLQRKHDRAEVWPHVELSTYTTANGAALYVENTGIGPAVIKSVVVTVDGKRVHNWNEVLTAVLGHPAGAFSNSTIVAHGIRPGDKVTMVGVPTQDLPPGFWKSIARIGITICYASVFDEYWQLRDTRLGGQTVWEHADSCPPQRADEEF